MTLKVISTHPSFRRLMCVVVKKWVSYLPAGARSWERSLSSEEVCVSHHSAITRDFGVLIVPANELSSILRCRKDEKCILGKWTLEKLPSACGQESSVDESTVCIREGVFKQNHTQTSYVLTAAHSTAAMAHPYVPMSLRVLPLQNVSTLNNENQLSFQSLKWPTLVTDSTGPSFQKGKVKTFMCVDVQLLS